MDRASLYWATDLTRQALALQMTTDLAHFSGSWPDEDRNLVTLALARLEASSPEYPEPSFGCRWVCVLEQVGGRTFYMAHRLSDTRPVWATSIEDFLRVMRERIEALTDRPGDSAARLSGVRDSHAEGGESGRS